MAHAAIAAGADGIMVEVHPDPDGAKVDGDQSLDFAMFEGLAKSLGEVARAVGRSA
jgi:3-deoxy-7-phosphoheptulonate synthase